MPELFLPSWSWRLSSRISLTPFFLLSSTEFQSHTHSTHKTAVQCPDIESADPNLVIITENGDRSFTATASFACPSGFTLQGGPSVVTCNSSGSWSHTIPFCEGKSRDDRLAGDWGFAFAIIFPRLFCFKNSSPDRRMQFSSPLFREAQSKQYSHHLSLFHSFYMIHTMDSSTGSTSHVI